MSHYEIVIMVDARLASEKKSEMIKQVEDILTKSGAQVQSSDMWIEKHKTDFRIKKVQEFSYYLIKFSSETTAIEKIRATLKLNEAVFRFLITKSEKVTA